MMSESRRKYLKKYMKDYRERNKNKIKLQVKGYREINKEKIKEYYEKNKKEIYLKRKGYRERNKNKLSEKSRLWSQDHRERMAFLQQNYNQKNPEKIMAHTIANKIKPDNKCNICSKDKQLHRHHPDYTKPKMIITLCSGCHKELHTLLKQAEKK